MKSKFKIVKDPNGNNKRKYQCFTCGRYFYPEYMTIIWVLIDGQEETGHECWDCSVPEEEIA